EYAGAVRVRQDLQQPDLDTADVMDFRGDREGCRDVALERLAQRGLVEQLLVPWLEPTRRHAVVVRPNDQVAAVVHESADVLGDLDGLVVRREVDRRLVVETRVLRADREQLVELRSCDVDLHVMSLPVGAAAASGFWSHGGEPCGRPSSGPASMGDWPQLST